MRAPAQIGRWKPRRAIMVYAAFLLVAAAMGVLSCVWNLSEPSRHSGWFLVAIAFNFAFVAFILWNVAAVLRTLPERVRDVGGTPADIPAARVGTAAGLGGFLNAAVFGAFSSAGWAWGTVFFGISGAFLVHLLLLYRSYARAASGEEL
jgi:hypothetical protein